MATESKLMTADELLQLPHGSERHELVRGELYTMSPPGEEHGWVSANITTPLGLHVGAHQLGRVYNELGCKLEFDPDTVRATDGAFIRAERLEARPSPGYWLGAPDLVVEVISPNDRYGEVDEKVAMWLEHGAQMVLAANPRNRTVMLHRPGLPPQLLTEADTIDGGDVVPGWRLAVREVFG